MVAGLPAEERAMLQPSDTLVVGAVYDAEFNGYVERCEPGFAISLSVPKRTALPHAGRTRESVGSDRTTSFPSVVQE
jgi:hypothetical protein